MTHVVVDPVTRIEGHLRIEAEVDGGLGQGRLVLLDDVPRHRDHPEGPRPPRRLGFCAAHLRRLHDGPRHRVDPGGRERDRRRAAAQRPPAAQPDHRVAVRSRTTSSTSTTCTPWTGSTSSRRSRPIRRRPRRAWRSRSRTGRCLPTKYFADDPESGQGVRRAGAARTVRQRVLGPPRLQAAAGGEPHGGGALPRGPRLAAGVHQDPRHPRREEPASPELPRGRHGHADRSRPAGLAERRTRSTA